MQALSGEEGGSGLGQVQAGRAAPVMGEGGLLEEQHTWIPTAWIVQSSLHEASSEIFERWFK